MATRLPEPGAEDGLRRVSWTRTLLRLTVEPDLHPWSSSWRLRRRGPLLAVALAVLLLLLFAASGCASGPQQSVRDWTASPRPASGMHCESMVVSREVQLPPEGSLGDVRLTIQDVPKVLGKLRVLVRRPRFPATLSLQSEGKAEFDKVLEVAPATGQTDLTIVLGRPDGASSDWPRSSCKACRVDVELTGLFGGPEGMEAFFIRALHDATAIDRAFASQERAGPSRPSASLLNLAEQMSVDARRCGASVDPVVRAVTSAIAALDRARARLYASEVPEVPDAKSVLRAWELANEVVEAEPVAAAAARAMGWPASLRPRAAGRLSRSALHLDLLEQVSSLAPEDQRIAAQWIALAMSPDDALARRNSASLPRIRDLADAEARLAWVDPRPGTSVPIPGLSHPAPLLVREWPAPRHGKKCIGRLGAAPVRDPEDDARAVAQLLSADGGGNLQMARASDLRAARDAVRRSKALLCEPPSLDPSGLFKGLEDKDLGEVAERLRGIFREIDPQGDDPLARAVSARTSQLFCKLFDPQNVQRRVTSLAGYKMFVEGGTHVLDLLAGPVVCEGRALPAREIRQRLREAYRAALERHAVSERLCPLRAGKCPEEVAASVRKLFYLSRPQLAAPVSEASRALEFPPPFGFSDEWVSKLDRCAREACESLSRLRSEAPMGQFEGPVCPPRADTDELPQEVAIRRPESPSSITLSSCDAHAGVRLTLHRFPDAGTLVAIASSQKFRYGSETVERVGRHPQLGRIYERVADLSDPGDVSRRSQDIFEVALTPTVENQVFYFFSLRRRDY